jgi:hypothetical protein
MRLFSNFLQMLDRRIQQAGEPYVAFGIFGIVNYLMYYPWSVWQSGSLQYPYLYRHLFDLVISTLLILKNRWPVKLVKYQPLFFYFCVLFTSPYSNALYFMQHGLTLTTVANSMLVLLIMILVLDWLSFIILLILGILAAYIVYHLTTGPLPFTFTEISNFLYTLMCTIFVAVFFQRMLAANRHNQQIEKKENA